MERQCKLSVQITSKTRVGKYKSREATRRYLIRVGEYAGLRNFKRGNGGGLKGGDKNKNDSWGEDDVDKVTPKGGGCMGKKGAKICMFGGGELLAS